MAQSHLAAPRQFPCNALWDLGKGPKENIEIFVRSLCEHKYLNC